MGAALGSKANNALTGYLKVYVGKKRVRIVCKINKQKVEVFIIIVGKRDNMKVYKTASSRV